MAVYLRAGLWNLGEWAYAENHSKVMTFILFPVLHDYAEVEINSAFKQRK
jgi:hypothetical protein